MTSDELAFVARVLAQATGKLTGDVAIYEAGMANEQTTLVLHTTILRFAHHLDAQRVERIAAEAELEFDPNDAPRS